MSKKEYEQDVTGEKLIDLKVNELIDSHFIEFVEFLQDKNVGVLKGFRAVLQYKLDQLDLAGKELVESKVTVFNVEERIKLGSVFAIIAKISDRMGYIDYLLKERKIKFDKSSEK